jgi:hypothetical protein
LWVGLPLLRAPRPNIAIAPCRLFAAIQDKRLG